MIRYLNESIALNNFTDLISIQKVAISEKPGKLELVNCNEAQRAQRGLVFTRAPDVADPTMACSTFGTVQSLPLDDLVDEDVLLLKAFCNPVDLCVIFWTTDRC